MNIGLKMKKYKMVMIAIAIIPFVFGCKDNTPKVKDIKYTDLQITGFSLEKKNDNILKGVKFSINNNYGKENSNGNIYNTNKIEYGLSIDSVKLNIDYSVASVAYLEYSIGGTSNFKKFNPKTDSIFIGNERTIAIKLISNKVIDKSRIYNIDLRQYDYKSGTVDYEPSHSLDFAIGDWSKAITLSNRVEIFSNLGTLKRCVLNDNYEFSNKEILGIPPSETVKNIIYVDDNNAYAVTSKGAFYKKGNNSNSFTVISSENIVALLGYIRNNNKTNIALIKRATDGKSYFATYDGNTFSLGQEVPNDFPITEFESINSNEQWVGDNIHLIGGLDANGSFTNKVWYTTNGTDWLNTDQKGLPDNIKNSSLTKYNNEIYQLVSTIDNKIKLFVSSDNGVNWREIQEGLPTQEFNQTLISEKPFLIFSYGEYMYIVVGNDNVNSIYYKGILRRLVDK